MPIHIKKGDVRMSNKMEQEFVINRVELKVHSDFEPMEKLLKEAENAWEENYFTEAWTVEDGNVTKDAYFNDIASARTLLTSIKDNPLTLEEYVQKARKKKNGEFWSGSVVTIALYESISTYYTEFTNSWEVLQLRLKVQDGKNCVMELIYKFETN